MPFRATSEQKLLIRQMITVAMQYRLTHRLGLDVPVATKIPKGAEGIWCEQIEQILTNYKIYISSEGEDV